MDRIYWESQVELINVIEKYCGEIRAMKVHEDSMEIVAKVYDKEIEPTLNQLCREFGFVWNYEPYTLQGKCNKSTVKEYPAVRFTFTLI